MTNLELARLYRLMCRIRDLLLNTENWEWAAWVDRGAALMEQGDPDAIERFLAAFGGMDGIDREVNARIERRNVSDVAFDDANSALAALLTEAHIAASQLRDITSDRLAFGDREEPQSVEVLASP